MFTKETVVGLDIGTDQVAVAQVDVRSGGHVRLVHAACARLAPGMGADGVAEALRRLWKDQHLNCYSVVSCLRASSLVVRHFRFPSLTDQELIAALKLEAEEVLQLEADQIALDWHENAAGTASGDSRGREGVLVAVPQAELERHQAILEAANLVPVVIDAGCTALGNAYMALRAEDCRAHAVCVVNLMGSRADMAILHGNGAMYPRCIANLGDGERRDRLLADSLTDVLKYYEFKLRREPVTDLVITGPDPGIQTVCENVQRRVGLPVAAWDPCGDIPLMHPRLRRMLAERPECGRGLSAAIGAAMRG